MKVYLNTKVLKTALKIAKYNAKKQTYVSATPLKELNKLSFENNTLEITVVNNQEYSNNAMKVSVPFICKDDETKVFTYLFTNDIFDFIKNVKSEICTLNLCENSIQIDLDGNIITLDLPYQEEYSDEYDLNEYDLQNKYINTSEENVLMQDEYVQEDFLSILENAIVFAEKKDQYKPAMQTVNFVQNNVTGYKAVLATDARQGIIQYKNAPVENDLKNEHLLNVNGAIALSKVLNVLHKTKKENSKQEAIKFSVCKYYDKEVFIFKFKNPFLCLDIEFISIASNYKFPPLAKLYLEEKELSQTHEVTLSAQGISVLKLALENAIKIFGKSDPHCLLKINRDKNQFEISKAFEKENDFLFSVPFKSVNKPNNEMFEEVLDNIGIDARYLLNCIEAHDENKQIKIYFTRYRKEKNGYIDVKNRMTFVHGYSKNSMNCVSICMPVQI